MHPHLTSEQMERMLHDPQAKANSLHLQVCPECVAELDELATTFSELRNTSTQHAITERKRAIVTPTASRRSLSAWAYALAAAILFTAGILPLALHHNSDAREQAKTPRSVVHQPISDEALLNSIQSDLSASVPEAMEPLATTTNSSNANTSRKN